MGRLAGSRRMLSLRGCRPQVSVSVPGFAKFHRPEVMAFIDPSAASFEIGGGSRRRAHGPRREASTSL